MLKTTLLPISYNDFETITSILNRESIPYEVYPEFDVIFSCSEKYCEKIMKEISENSPNEIQAIHRSSRYNYYGAFKKKYRLGKVTQSFFTFDYNFQWVTHFIENYKTVEIIESKLSEFFLKIDEVYEISYLGYNSLHFCMNDDKTVTVEMDISGYHVKAIKGGPHITVSSSEFRPDLVKDDQDSSFADSHRPWKERSQNIIVRDFDDKEYYDRIAQHDSINTESKPDSPPVDDLHSKSSIADGDIPF